MIPWLFIFRKKGACCGHSKYFSVDFTCFSAELKRNMGTICHNEQQWNKTYCLDRRFWVLGGSYRNKFWSWFKCWINCSASRKNYFWLRMPPSLVVRNLKNRSLPRSLWSTPSILKAFLVVFLQFDFCSNFFSYHYETVWCSCPVHLSKSLFCVAQYGHMFCCPGRKL